MKMDATRFVYWWIYFLFLWKHLPAFPLPPLLRPPTPNSTIRVGSSNPSPFLCKQACLNVPHYTLQSGQCPDFLHLGPSAVSVGWENMKENTLPICFCFVAEVEFFKWLTCMSYFYAHFKCYLSVYYIFSVCPKGVIACIWKCKLQMCSLYMYGIFLIYFFCITFFFFFLMSLIEVQVPIWLALFQGKIESLHDGTWILKQTYIRRHGVNVIMQLNVQIGGWLDY